MGSALSKKNPEIRMAVQAKIDTFITENKVMVFSKSRCPGCLKAKAALKQFTDDFTVLEVRGGRCFCLYCLAVVFSGTCSRDMQ